ncbi:MAG: hypothetical protein K0U72_00875 [Gammaproteobacteria bacterium]|nr:hypothetical protein [Gammaproteobacteria bacterium]
MRELTANEMQFVVGGFGCHAGAAGGSGSGSGDDAGGDSGNSYGGVSDTTSVGDDIINIYEGLVQATSHIIERVATSF